MKSSIQSISNQRSPSKIDCRWNLNLSLLPLCLAFVIARSYEVWTANNTKQLYLANETKIDKLEMKMTPREAYSKEKAVITVSDPENPQMVAIVAYDHHGKPSQISNIVSARLKKVPKNKAKNTGQSNTTSIGQSTTGSIIGLIVGLVFCFSMVVL